MCQVNRERAVGRPKGPRCGRPSHSPLLSISMFSFIGEPVLNVPSWICVGGHPAEHPRPSMRAIFGHGRHFNVLQPALSFLGIVRIKPHTDSNAIEGVSSDSY